MFSADSSPFYFARNFAILRQLTLQCFHKFFIWRILSCKCVKSPASCCFIKFLRKFHKFRHFWDFINVNYLNLGKVNTWLKIWVYLKYFGNVFPVHINQVLFMKELLIWGFALKTIYPWKKSPDPTTNASSSSPQFSRFFEPNID